MKPEHHFCTPEQAERLKALGICQENSLGKWAFEQIHEEKKLHINGPFNGQYFAAFNVAEMGLMFKAINMQIPLINMANLEFGRANSSGAIISDDVEAHARAEFLIHYLELLQNVNNAQFREAIEKINDLLTKN